MKVLVACEESQEVCKAFREKGHESYSCDIQECSGGHPEWHVKGDVSPLLKRNCTFITCDLIEHKIDKWDLIIAHPPCTDLCVSGARHFSKKRANGSQEESIKFFKQFIDADCDRIAIENPVGIIGGDYIKKWFPMYADIPKCTQVIQPYEYGHHARKTTCLWLKNLPPLIPTNIVDPGYIDSTGHSLGASSMYAVDENGKILSWNDPRTAKARSKTFTGIAQAMADQWGNIKTLKEKNIMKDFELVTIKKGEIKTVDAFIKSFNAVGSNMRALSVSAYKFLTDDNIEVRKEFKTRCLDELNMSNATISFLKTSGMLYCTSDVFYDFPYTNVVLFKKAIDHYVEKNYPYKLAWEFVDDDICENVICELAKLHYSRVNDKDTEECKLQLLALSQKELRHLIDVYASDKEDTPEDTSEDATDDVSNDTPVDAPTEEEMEEVNSHYITYIDDDIYEIISLLADVNTKMSKQTLIDIMKCAIDMLNGGMRKC